MSAASIASPILHTMHQKAMKVLPERLIDPFGRRAVKLHPADLTQLQKQWFVNEVTHFEVSYKYCNGRYGLHESCVKGLVHKFKNKKSCMMMEQVAENSWEQKSSSM